jgi:DNA-binding MarR family transcriptional regulator
MIEPPSTVLDQHQDHLDRRVTALIFQLSRHLATSIDRRMAPFNVTGQQAALLVRSSVAPDSTPTQLAPWLGTDNAGITRLLDRLEAKGLIVRRMSATDRRAVVVELTPAGRALIPHLVLAFRALSAQLIDGFAPDELAALEALLRRMVVNVETAERGDKYG